MMKEIAEICEKNQLRYYLCGGTLLGAVRHGGFIPWDDDLDITMYRSDLNRLITILQTEYSDKFFVQTFQTDRNYTRYIPKIRLNGTIQMEEGHEEDKIHHGVYIDIFPLDHVAKPGGWMLYLRGKILRFLFAYKTVRCTKNKVTTKTKKLLITLLKPLSYLIPMKWVDRMFDWVCTASDKAGAKYTTSFASHYLWKKQLVENDIYGDGTMLRFENCMFRCPTRYTDLLKQVFGENYMQLPPLEKRNSGHVLVKIDLGQYETAVEDLLQPNK